METTTKIHDQEINRMEFKNELLISPTINHALYKNEVLDNTIVYRRLSHVLEEKVDNMATLNIIPDLLNRKSKRHNNHNSRR